MTEGPKNRSGLALVLPASLDLRGYGGNILTQNVSQENVGRRASKE